ncbi:hypothetical protein QVD17_16236 [Tagetes erecta]|uniref:Uncharacterized protein n=1 Tax=Tagetes erecta TaxID=13708 RepID=A0AAD8P0I2_TARER|nr:hypothetical protein QVD17_16236 [Tagetes erecta]
MANKSHKTFYLPMFCKSSITDTINPHKSSTDPSSPKLTCIGQIKKKPSTTTNNNNNNRFLVTNISDPATVNSTRYNKLHKLFSGKNLISPAIDTSCVTSTNKLNSKCVTRRSKSYNGRGRTPVSKKKCYVSKDVENVMRVVVDEEELDPPLPVVKCRRDRELDVNLWKRRGIEMKSLQIQPIQLSLNRIGSKNGGEFSIATSVTTF